MRRWHDQSNYLIILSAADESALLDIHNDIMDGDVPFSLIHEPDLTGYGPNGSMYTALAIAPSEVIARRLSSLPLALREPSMA